MSSPAHGSPWWSAEKEFALLMLLTDGNRKAAQRLWLRKLRIHREAPLDAGASAPKAATAKPQPAPARAQAVPKLETAAQLARRERSQIRLRQKHLASKIWASVRVASRLLAWWSRARARQSYWHGHYRGPALDEFVERSASLGPRAAASTPPGPLYLGVLRRKPILVGTLLAQQWPSLPRVPNQLPVGHPRASTVAPPPATQLAALAPPSQQPTHRIPDPPQFRQFPQGPIGA